MKIRIAASLALTLSLVACSKADPEVAKTCEHNMKLLGVSEDARPTKLEECVKEFEAQREKVPPQEFQRMLQCWQDADTIETASTCIADGKIQ